ncbi:MAG: HAD family hydrolase [Kiritimatiellae bacterium]|nr:HAD family hydrolase [Kiritimatiellia bacterium]
MNTLPYLIWDWNGTLIDDVSAAVNALNRMLSIRGVAPVTRDFYRARFGFPVRPFYAVAGLDMEKEDWDKICTDFHRFIAEEPDQHLRQDARDALQLVRDRGGRQSILSALRQDLLHRDTAREEVQPFFDAIFGVDNLDGATKLSRGHDLISHLKSTGRLAPSQPLFFIGDTLHDAEVGAAIGATPVLVDGGHQNGDRLRASGQIVVPSLLAAVNMALG